MAIDPGTHSASAAVEDYAKAIYALSHEGRDPVPTRDLVIAEDPTDTLASLEPGTRGRFVRISDSDPDMLRYLADRGIAPGDDFEIVDKQPFGGPSFARFAG